VGRITVTTAIGAIGNEIADGERPGALLRAFSHAWCIRAAKPGSGKTMSVDDKKTKATAKKEPAPESKAAETAPKTEGVKTEAVKTEAVKAEAAKPDAAPPPSKGMGEGQKPVSQAYKDNWNAIFAKEKNKKKKKR
jgi:hypothetical protein